ncbi:MAG TPA: helix-turn-helix transcriptional regulator [Ktedonobacteraceae bacterium]|jgi:plasmid maintenance system antidote protein VapI
MNLEYYRVECGWSKNEMARQARIDVNTLNRAMAGETITLNTAKKLAHAISKALGQTIQYQQIEGLNVNV